MKIARVLVLMALAFKVLVLGTWWSGTATTRAAEAAKEEPAPVGGGPVPADLLARSRGFRELLEAVRQRGADLDRREQAVGARESALKTLEKTLADEVTRLEALTKSDRSAADAPSGAASPGVPVTKVYESMKPDEAAPIFDKLDERVALGILGRMKEKQIGAILAAMNRDRAVVLTRLLAGSAPAPETR